MFHLRFDHRSEADLEKHIDFIRRLPAKHTLVVLEGDGDRVKFHTHAIFDDDRSKSGLGQAWKKKFPDYDGKKGEYALAEVPEAEVAATKRYLCKGPLKNGLGDFPKVLLKKGEFNDDVINSLHVEYWKINAELKAKHGVGKTVIHEHQHVLVRAPKKKKPNFFEQVIEHIDRLHPDRTWTVADSPTFINILYKMHGVNFRPWGPAQLVTECRVLLNHYCHDEFQPIAYAEVRPLAIWLP